MLRITRQVYRCLIPVLLIALFLLGCSTPDTTRETVNEPEDLMQDETYTMIDQSQQFVQKIVGWLDNSHILVHIGDQEEQELIHVDIYSGEQTLIYQTAQHILSVEINSNLDKIVMQEGAETAVDLVTLTRTGEELNRTGMDYAGYVNLDWNAVDDDLIFVSHYQFDQETFEEYSKVMIWNLVDNTLLDYYVDSIEPVWYSSHLYLYMNEMDGHLYIGDTRSIEEDRMINNETIDFYMHEDTFLSLEESDINENQVHLMKDYPFLVHQGALTIPKVTRGEIIVSPFLSQSNRNGIIAAVIAEDSIDLNNDLGSFSLALLDFEDRKVEKIIELPDNAPITLSPDERHALYGWQLEYLIEIGEHARLFSLISGPV